VGGERGGGGGWGGRRDGGGREAGKRARGGAEIECVCVRERMIHIHTHIDL
jgi:hypothetical protein